MHRHQLRRPLHFVIVDGQRICAPVSANCVPMATAAMEARSSTEGHSEQAMRAARKHSGRCYCVELVPACWKREAGPGSGTHPPLRNQLSQKKSLGRWLAVLRLVEANGRP